jgi:hypothetical protein
MTLMVVDPSLIAVIVEGNLAFHVSMDGEEMCHEVLSTGIDSRGERQ